MPFNATKYSKRMSPVHRVDARVKIMLLLVYSVSLFWVESWAGLIICAMMFAACAALSHLQVGRAAVQLAPFGIVLAITLIANAFTVDAFSSAQPLLGNASAGFLAGMPSVPLIGSFGFTPPGFARGCFYVTRIALLLMASLILTSTTTSTQLTRALEGFLAPLGRVGAPTHDIATIVSIALRFIPVTVDEFQMVRAAQTARGAAFDARGIGERLNAWQTVLIPLFVGLYRRADDLACAMDARCYGGAQATQLDPQHFGAASALQLVLGCALCVAVGAIF